MTRRSDYGSHSEDLLVPEVFIEHITDNGGAIGISCIPTRELGNKSRSDTTTTGDGQDTGTYKAKAELKNFIMIYGRISCLLSNGWKCLC